MVPVVPITKGIMENADCTGSPLLKELQRLRRRIADLKAVEAECRMAQQTLEKTVESQNALNLLLKLSLEEVSLDRQLTYFLELLLSVSWLKTLYMGGIFLTDEEDPEVLVLRKHMNLNRAILNVCARVPFGRCLCGRAAAEREIQVSDRVDHRHDINYPGLEHHGHYNVPVLSNGNVLGVIVLYLPAGQEGDPHEISFLKAAASTLAGMIKRKRAENELRQSERRYRTIFENTGTATALIGEDSVISLVNSEFETLSGYPKGAIQGKVRWTDFLLAEDTDAMEQYHRSRMALDPSVPDRWEARVITRAKEVRDVVLQIAPIPDTRRSILSILDITDRIQAEYELSLREMELRSQSSHLKEVNSALKVLLYQRELDKKELENSVLSNVNDFIIPFIDKMKTCKLDTYYESILIILEKSLKDMVSPFLSRLYAMFDNLTPMEIQVANLIKVGKTSKEIADILRRSENTIIFHRNNVRRKLGLKNAKRNLRSFLLSFEK